MKQLTLATVAFERYARTTRRAAFLAEMERVVPWSARCAFHPNAAALVDCVATARSLVGELARLARLAQVSRKSEPCLRALSRTSHSLGI